MAVRYPIHFKALPILTPKGNPFEVPTLALKNSIEDEMRDLKAWPSKLTTQTMTALALSACDRIKGLRDAVIQGLLQNLETDLLLLWVNAPPALLQLQKEFWLPLVQKFNAEMEMDLHPVMTLSTPSVVSALKLKNYLESLSDFQLVGLSHLEGLTHSLILAVLAIKCGISQVFEASELHETFQRSLWGEEPLDMERSAQIQKEVEETLAFLGCLNAH
ncbi:ATP12 chaperone protein [Candidatus Bealeia paramacronuclearis]|uniref:ATP12 chaperone protein n=1 Tax=Candidatus Bealeia paramacronuclearis TaxID=1921001 RepID=A0ABZ2C780_9PROT|nr:ATP12 chaperone protein [Candidatus Bealeia paramacronuclearis]